MFKVGDIVKCIDASSYEYLKEGSTYVVQAIDEYRINIRTGGSLRWYPSRYFALASDKKRLNDLQEALETVRRVKEGYEKEGYIVTINNFKLEKIERSVVKTSVETLYP